MARHTFTRIDSKGKSHTGATVLGDRKPNPGTENIRRNTPLADYHAKFCAGRNHGRSKGSIDKEEQAAKHMSVYMQKREGLEWFGSIKQGHWDRFVEHLTTKPSLLDKHTKTIELSDGKTM